jgi:hypothetical protein
LQSGESIIGLSRRPADGQLYAIGNTNRLYTINMATATATQVGSAGNFSLSGFGTGTTFDPTADVLRVTTTSEQNLRINPTNATLISTDTPLAYASGDPHTGTSPSIVGSAYSNQLPGATTTTLYGIDSSLHILVTQDPANAGTLHTIGALGDSNIEAGRDGFAISGASGTAFAALTQNAGNFSQLYSIDLTTGAATLLGNIGNASPFDSPLVGLAAPVSTPEPSSLALVGIGGLIFACVSRRKARGRAPRDNGGEERADKELSETV